MPRKPTISSLTDKLDKEWSLIVRAENENRCERCGAPATQVHHIYTRDLRRIRFDRRNLMAACFKCHEYAHKHSFDFRDWFESVRPDDFAFIRDPKNRAPIHRSIPDLEELLAEARVIRKRLETDMRLAA